MSRNNVVRKIAAGSFRCGAVILRFGMPYLTERALISLGNICEEMKTEMKRELYLRKKINKNPHLQQQPDLMRDSSVLELREKKEAAV